MLTVNFAAVRNAGIACVLGVTIAAPAALPAAPVTLDDYTPMLNSEVRDFDVRQSLGEPTRVAPSAAQQDALRAFVERHPDATLRWHDASGSIDIIYGFAAQTSGSTPQAAARNFIAANTELLGITDMAALQLDANTSRAALGGHLLRFEQVMNGVPVVDAGIGIVMDGNNNVRAVSGPFYTLDVAGTAAGITASQAVTAAENDLSLYARNLPQAALDYLVPAYEIIEEQLGILTTPHPELAIMPDSGGGRLVWRFFEWSRNPFGMFQYSIDANTGEILSRENFVRTRQDELLPFTADVFPTSPPITDALKERGALLDANGGEVERPLGQVRVGLRKIDESNVVSGTQGVLTGDHALITNALPTRQTFGQAAAATWHFDRDELPLKGRTDEVDHLAEPAEHQDEISQFFYITSFIEYLDYLHRAGDDVHNRGVGDGDFPDSYPNDDTPLSGTVHIPNVLAPPSDTSDPAFLRKLLALDNAFAVPVSTEVAGQPVVVNPTAYGHGYIFNDLAIDFAVPLHEGTHATITPIAGLEGSPEGGALNEGQADVWAYTIGENPRLGSYIVNSFRLREQIRADGGNPDSVEWLRHGDSQLRYSQLGTDAGTGSFEVHQDGEIYAAALWDIRQLMLSYRSGGSFVRPNQITGEASDAIPLGKELFERMFLGSMYVLGTMAPDTFVRARDALIIADDVLHPGDPLDLDAPGRHRALIERVFAAREIGKNAAAPSGGRQTISSAVSDFTAGVAKPATPQGVLAEPTADDEIRLSWEPADAFAYQVLKRPAGKPAERLFAPGEQRPGLAPGRDYLDGDQAFSGFTHVEYVFDGAHSSYVDRGQWFATHAGLGLEDTAFDYAVRAIHVAPDGQVGFSDLSATAGVALETANVTDNVDSRIADPEFADGEFSFDVTLENTGGAGNFDGTIFEPITFKIIDISDDTVTAANADNGGSGQNGDEAHYVFGETLSEGEVSPPRRLVFDNPEGRLFTIDIVVTGRVRIVGTPANGSQDAVDTAERAEPPEEFHFVENFTGVVPIGTTGATAAEGVDHVDVPFTTQPSVVAVTGTLSADPTVAAYPDLDFELRDTDGNVLSTSASFGPDEQVGSSVEGDTEYVYRVIGWANGPTTFSIVSDQLVDDPDDAGGTGPGSGAGGITQLTVDPLSGSVTVADAD